MIKIVLALAIVASISAQAVKLPVGIVPGLGDFCGNPISMGRLVREIQGEVDNQIFCIDAAPSVKSFISSFKSQLETACKITNDLADKYNLKNGFILMGLSQGGLLARGIVEHCEMGQYAKKLITLGGPHQGVSQIPHTGMDWFSNIVNKVADELVYTSLVQDVIGPVGYFHRPDLESAYRASGIVLADLNNAGPTKNPEYVKRIANLEKIVLVMFSKDTMVLPKETAHWGFWKDYARKEVVDLEDQDVVNDLDLADKIANGHIVKLVFQGDHLQFSHAELQSLFAYF